MDKAIIIKTLKDLLLEINKVYSLGDQELLEAKRLEEAESKVRSELEKIVNTLNDEILTLKLKKLNSGMRGQLKSIFHNKKTAESSLEKFRLFISEIIATKTIKRRFETEGLFVELRAQNEDQHLIIGKRNGTPEKAHVIIDGKTGDIRVEDGQLEPTGLVPKIESILTLPNGKRIKTTREVIEELPTE